MADTIQVVPSAARKLPPGPASHYLVRNFVDLTSDWLGFLTRCAREYGDVVYFRLLNTPVCLLSHPDDIESVLVTQAANFEKSRDYRALGTVIGNGLLKSEGNFWRAQRKLIQPAFHNENVLRYSRIMVEDTQRMLATWRDGETRDIQQEMSRLALEIVAKSLFGANVSSEAANVSEALKVVSEQLYNAANLAMVFPEKLPLPSAFSLRRAVRRLDEIIYPIIRKRRAAANGSPDLLGMLLAAQENGNRMTDRQLRDEVMTLFLAGHETTALALSWTFFLLSRHPAVEEKLLAELRAVLGRRAPAPGDLARLPYTDCVVKEALRLYPPAWGIGRRAIRAFEVGGYRLPAGTNIFILQWIVHRDARFYASPETFNPDRWRGDPVGRGALPRFAYLPFGAGPRVCVGASFALMEARLLLATILPRFHLEVVPGHPVEIQPSVTLRPRHGIKVVLQKRRMQEPVTNI